MTAKHSSKPLAIALPKASEDEDFSSQETASPPKDKLGALRAPDSPGPRAKRWFRKQFGISARRKSRDDSLVQLTWGNVARGHRRTSSLPDLASMLEAATLKTRTHTISEALTGRTIAAKNDGAMRE